MFGRYVISLTLARDLANLGVEQKSLFNWHYISEVSYEVKYHTAKTQMAGEFIYSAFTAGELGEMLPVKLGDLYFTSHRCSLNGWFVMYEDSAGNDKHCYMALNEADARAKLLLGLIKAKVVTIK